jgi:hypothetical protein
MPDHEHVTITAVRVLGSYRVRIFVQSVDGDHEYSHSTLGPSYFEADAGSLQEVLEGLAEEVYNWAPLTGEDGDRQSPSSALGGSSHSSADLDKGAR